jgi:phosphoesterase RecJ-like protein
MKNCSLKEIGNGLLAAKTVLLFPHVQMDGDALGSASALCRALRAMGKEAHILINEIVPANILFLDEGFCTTDAGIITNPDVCLAVDCSDISRIEGRKTVFFQGTVTMCIDHHVTNEAFADLNFVDRHAASTGEISYRLLEQMQYPMDALSAQALYAAMATDTGNFTYSNTTRETHLIAASLFETGMDHSRIGVEIYQNSRPEKVKLTALCFATMEFVGEGKANIALITQDMLKQTGASMEETEGLVEQMRNISGVEISCIMKEDNGRIKVSMRSKTNGDVASIARNFGGGGHKKAAGFTLEIPMEEAKVLVKNAILQQLTSLEG